MLTEHGSIQAVNFCMGKLWLGTFAWVDSLIKDGKTCPVPRHIESGLTIMFFYQSTDCRGCKEIEGLFFES